MKPGDRVYLTRPLPLTDTFIELPVCSVGVVLEPPDGPAAEDVVPVRFVEPGFPNFCAWAERDQLAREA